GDAVGGFGAAVDEDALGEFAAGARIAFVALVVIVAGGDVAVVVGVGVAPAVFAGLLAVEGIVGGGVVGVGLGTVASAGCPGRWGGVGGGGGGGGRRGGGRRGGRSHARTGCR